MLFFSINLGFFFFWYAFGEVSSRWLKISLTTLYIAQQAIMVAIFLKDPGVAAKSRVEFESPLNENQAK